jgi:hypothetical protein
MPMQGRSMKTKRVTVKYGPTQHVVTLPSGLECVQIKTPGRWDAPKYWLDEFPENLFPPDSIEKHDAIHYGVVLMQDQVTKD